MKTTSSLGGRRLSMKNKRYVAGILFTMPAIIGILWLFVWPMIQSLIISLSNVTFDYAAGRSVNTWLGQANYVKALFEDANFVKYLLASVKQMLIRVPLVAFFSFFAATLINDKFPGRGAARFIFFLPLVISSATVMTLDASDLFQQSMNSGSFKSIDGGGFLQSLQMADLLQYTGLPEGISSFLLTAIDSVFETISLSGVQIIIILAALQSVSPSLYEMARVEGATAWEIFWKITFVMISPMLLLSAIYTIVDSFTAYDNTVIVYIQNTMYSMGNYGLASAMSWIYFVLVIIVLGIVAYAGSKLVFYYDK